MLTFIDPHLRRGFLICVTTLFVGTGLQAGDEPVNRVKIQVDPKTVVSPIAPDFIGFGYETSATAQSNYFSAKNTTLIQLYRNLSPHGLIRIGGNVSDHTKYVPDGTPAVHNQSGVSIINKANLEDLRDFARATGWTVMWGLNLATGSKSDAVEEALAVNEALGSSLQSFQIGNEVDFHFRKNYDAYHAAYLDYKAGIRAVLPNAPFSGPDAAGDQLYITNFADTEARDMKLLTTHYYRGDQGKPDSTLERLLQRDERLDKRLGNLRQLCLDQGLAYRINETNSFSGGGKQGVSDTFGSALWCLDYMYILASYGCDGVNMETDINHLAFISYYSPIVHDAVGNCSARPEYYGMLAFAMAGNGDLLKLTLDKGDINLSAYATKDKRGYLWITVVNKDLSQDADVEAVLPEGYATSAAFRLEAPSVNSTDQVTFAGAEVSADGKWTAGPPEQITVNEGAVHLQVPHASAVLVRLKN